MGELITLTQYEFAWELQAYLRFCGASFEEYNSPVPSSVNTGDLPQLRLDGDLFDSFNALTALRERVVDLDAALTRDQAIERDLLAASCEHDLGPAVAFFRWHKDEHGSGPSAAAAPAASPGPVGFVLRSLHAASALSRARSQGVTSGAEAERRAQRALGVLASRLEGRAYFFGSKPTSLDAVVFGAATALHEARPELLAAFRPLSALRERVLGRYFVPAPNGEPAANSFAAAQGHPLWPPLASRDAQAERGDTVADLDAGRRRAPAGGDDGEGAAGRVGARAGKHVGPAAGAAERTAAAIARAWGRLDRGSVAWVAAAAATVLLPLGLRRAGVL